MSDWGLLLLAAAVLYAIECLAWVKSDDWICCRKAISGGWTVRRGSRLPGNDRGGFALGDPVSFSGSVIFSRVWPFSISPDGLSDAAATVEQRSPTAPRYLALDQIRSVSAELDEIRINNETFCRALSSPVAAHFAKLIVDVRRQAHDDRAAAIKASVAATFDEQRLIGSWNQFHKQTRLPRRLSVALFTWGFIISPTVLLAFGAYPAWVVLLGGLGLLVLASAIAYFKAHSVLFPSCRYDRWVNAVAMTLYPPSAIRSVDKLSRDALGIYSPFVVGHLFCKTDVADLREHYFDLQESVAGGGAVDDSSSAARCESWFVAALLDETALAVKRLAIPLLDPPRPDDDGMVFYCPRCHTQFRYGASEICSECNRTTIVAFAKGSAGGQAAASLGMPRG